MRDGRRFVDVNYLDRNNEFQKNYNEIKRQEAKDLNFHCLNVSKVALTTLTSRS